MKKNLSVFLAVIMALTLIITQTGCAEKTEPVTKTSYYMDTMCKIDIYDMDDLSEEAGSAAINDAFALCADYESIISATVEGSDIWNINHAGGRPVDCDPRTVDIIRKGIAYGKASGGKFDITIGAVSDLWDFHDPEAKIPSKSDLAKVLPTVNYRGIQINGNRVALTTPGAEITLGGLGKGCVADAAAELLRQRGVTSAVVNFGGNIITIGGKKGGEEPFKIGVEKPYSNQGEIVGFVEVKDATVVTSGVYERYIEKNGKKYHHILDVKTGYSVDNDIDSVSLVSSKLSSGDCDAMSTICLMLGVKDGVKYIESVDGVEAIFIGKDGKITKTSGMNYFTEQK